MVDGQKKKKNIGKKKETDLHRHEMLDWKGNVNFFRSYFCFYWAQDFQYTSHLFCYSAGMRNVLKGKFSSGLEGALAIQSFWY